MESSAQAEVSLEALGQPHTIDPSRIPGDVDLRRHAARGTIVNSVFNVGLFGLGTFQRFAVAAWLSRSQYGMWGVLLGALFALTWIKQFGIGDKFIQQSEPDQEAAFQKAFTLELALSLAFVLLACVALPIYGVAYGRQQIIMPGIVLSLSVLLTAFESPSWIAYRRMQYARMRLMTVVDPVVTFVVAISLVASGLGYWGLIAGALAGSLAGGAVCTAISPYRLRLRFDRATLREYVSFSWPLVGFGLCGFITLQGTLLAANYAVGLAGIGAIGLAGNVVGMADGVDGIISQTIYPAVCAVAHRTQALAEAFVKSNRLALMWAIPTTAGIALFAHDLVHFVLGDRWAPAVGLFAAVAVTTGFYQVGFNWTVFLRAVGNTRPIFVGAVVEVLVFLSVSIPAILTLGLTGYAIGFAAVTGSQIVLRGYYMGRLFGGFSAFRQLVRGVIPTLPAVAVVLLMRLTLPAASSVAGAVVELVVYCAVATASTLVFERPLVLECISYLRKRTGRAGSLGGVAPVRVGDAR